MRRLESEVELPTGLIVPRHILEERERHIEELRQKADMYKALAVQGAKEESRAARKEQAEATLMTRRRRMANRGRRSHVVQPYQAYDVYLGYDKPRFPTQEALRAVADRSVTVIGALQRRNIQQRNLLRRARRDVPRVLGWNIVHEDFGKPGFKMSKAQEERADEIAEMLETPHESEPSLEEFLSKTLRDYLVIDRVAVELIPSRLAEIAPGVKKDSIVGFCATDGATIKPILEVALRWVTVEAHRRDQVFNPQQAERAFMVDMRDKYGIDATNKAYVQMIDGVPFAAFSDDEMIVQVTSPRSDIGSYGYGESPTEKAIWATMADMQTWAYQVNNFSEALPEILLCVAGAVDENIIADVEDQMVELATGVRNNRRIPMIQVEEKGGIQSIELRKSLADMGFDEWQTRTSSIALACFGMHPYEVNMSTQPNGQSTLQEANKDTEIELHSPGFMMVLHDQERLMTRIIRKKDPEYRWHWFGVDGLYDSQSKEEHDILAGRTKSYGSVNHTREQLGIEPLLVKTFKDLGNSKELSVQLATLAIIPSDMHQHASVLLNSDRQLRQEEKLEAQQAAQGGPGGPGGGPPGQNGGGGGQPPGQSGEEDQGQGQSLTDDPELNQILQGIDLGEGGDKEAAPSAKKKPAGKPEPGAGKPEPKKPAPKPMKKSWDDVIHIRID